MACWNIRGSSRKNALPEVKDFCRSVHVSIMMLCEVKAQSPPSACTAAQLGFQSFDFIPTQGFAGGIWLFWKPCNINPFSLNVIHKACRFIACNIYLRLYDFSFTAISEFTAHDGTVLLAPSSISDAITSEFTQRFVSNLACSFNYQEDFHLITGIISQADNDLLTDSVSGEEIKLATFDLAPDKSPGPDGFPPFFFQKYWTLVGNSVIRAVQAFFHSGILLKEVNHTFLALIPKVDNPSCANHFRPISLCSTIYKIISKVLTRRLKGVLGKIIHPLQGAFVPERLIQDNILLAHEIFHSFRRKGGKSGWIAIKLDMEKAHDRLEWPFVLTMLEKLGFCPRWISWVKECISTPSFSVLVNGVPGSSFRPSRGIRQGDPLSPYLFILCAELLARQFAEACCHRDKLIGVPIGHSGMRIPFLTFADDTMIFAKASNESCHLIRSILDKYCAMSGQLVNYHKSSFQVTANVPDSVKDLFSEILGMKETSDLGSYLGCPIISSRVTRETFSTVVSKVSSQLPKWKANSLSQAGRTVLIQANLATKANFQMQSFLLPKTILGQLDKAYRNFFWN